MHCKYIVVETLGAAQPHRCPEQARVEWCRNMIKKIEDGSSRRVYDNVEGDESWIYQYDPAAKRQSTVVGSPRSKRDTSWTACRLNSRVTLLTALT